MSATPEASAEAAFETSRDAIVRGMSEERTPDRALDLIRKIDVTVDQSTLANRRKHSESRAVECKQGCSHCCYRVVFATVPDLVRAENFIIQSFSPAALDDLRSRLYRYERAVAPRFGFCLDQVRTPCPFLVDGLCEIYAARPMQCRAVHSLDAGVCLTIKECPSSALSRPSIRGESEIAEAAYRGVGEGMRSIGLSTGTLDFGRAMAIALHDPSAIPKLFAGENRFTPAVSREAAPKLPRVARNAIRHRYLPGEKPKGKIGLADLATHFEHLNDGDMESALAALNSDHPVDLIRKILVPTLYKSQEEILYWRRRCQEAIHSLGEATFDPREAFDALEALSTFEIAYQQLNDKELLSELGQVLFDKITSKALPDLCEPIERKARSSKLKVGYISENLTVSNGGSWARGWLRNHGRDIERYVFCLSDTPDAITNRFRLLANQFFLMNGDVPAQARFIKSLDLDVLIFTDIGISGRNYQYATMRLAPVQCTAWGHPVTSGLPTIDYYLSSELMEPANAQAHYRERLVRLPGSGLSLPRRLVQPSRMTKADYGLDDGPLYLSCQNPMKYLPRWDFVYAEICVRTGRPIVFVEGPKAMDKQPLKDRFLKAGVRSVWLPNLSMSDFFALVKLADVCLDTPGWNGGNTTVQALQEGVPVVTLPGEFMRGRHGLAFCQVASVPGLIASSTEDYVRLACDRERIAQAMANLDSEALFESKSPVAALDEFLRQAASNEA